MSVDRLNNAHPVKPQFRYVYIVFPANHLTSVFLLHYAGQHSDSRQAARVIKRGAESDTLRTVMGEDLNIKLALQQAITQLHGNPSAALDAEILLCHALRKPRSYLFTWPERLLNNQQLNDFRVLLERRAKGEPVAYIIGTREFWSLPFRVNQHTLIPRPETELLVESALELGNCNGIKKERLDVVDLGTGCGCIALSLAKEKPHWRILATDYSAAALETAQYNAVQLGVDNVEFTQSNWFEQLDPAAHYDLILSNPPYIAEDATQLKQGDIRHEPQDALVSGKDGLDAIRILVSEGFMKLKNGGWIIFEIGYDQSDRVAELVDNAGFNCIMFKKDLAGIKRVCIAHRP